MHESREQYYISLKSLCTTRTVGIMGTRMTKGFGGTYGMRNVKFLWVDCCKTKPFFNVYLSLYLKSTSLAREKHSKAFTTGFCTIQDAFDRL